MANQNIQDNVNSLLFGIQKSQVHKNDGVLPKQQFPAPSGHSKGPLQNGLPSEITIKDFFDFMKTAYQVYECVEGNDEDIPNGMKIDWDDLEKNAVIKMLMDTSLQGADDPAAIRRGSEGGAPSDSSESTPGRFLFTYSEDSNDCQNNSKNKKGEPRRNSLSTFTRKSYANRKDSKVDSDDNQIDSILKTKLSDVLNEGILDSVLPYMVGHAKVAKTCSSHQPIIKKPVTFSTSVEVKKPASFSGFLTERDSKEKLGVPSRDKLGRRKSSIGGEKAVPKGDGEVEIHVCDEVKGMKRDFRCPQKLLVSKMGYFADVTSGQKLEEMDISVHCDIQIFDWLMRWVKKDTILVADWPILDPSNVVPILVSASFLQMDPLLHDCLMYCHSHMSDIVKTNTNLACLNDTILTRLGAMYTNSELEAIKDRKDKIQSRLFCKMIMSLGEPVSETLRGHYSSLATIYKCNKCSKLLPRQTAERVPCQPSSMSIDRWGNILSAHTRDLTWNLSEYITGLHVEMKSWRKVYWRLWGECHFLKCSTCDNFFPVYQMEWCCYHADVPQFFTLEPARPTCLPIGRYPCCSERAYRFQVLSNNTGCQFREHTPDQKSDCDVAVLAIYNNFKEVITLEPPQLIFPERLTRLMARELGDETGRLTGREVFWWDGLRLAPPRQPLGLLGKLYSGTPTPKIQVGNKPPGSEAAPLNSAGRAPAQVGASAVAGVQAATCVSPSSSQTEATSNADSDGNPDCKTVSKIPSPAGTKEQSVSTTTESKDDSSSDAGDVEESSSSSAESSHSEESSPPRSPPNRRAPLRNRPRFLTRRRAGCGRQWAAALSARSNQDQQRQFEERAARQMRALLARRATHHHPRQSQPLGGVYVKLEAEWRECTLPPPSVVARPPRHLYSAKAFRSKQTK